MTGVTKAMVCAILYFTTQVEPFFCGFVVKLKSYLFDKAGNMYFLFQPVLHDWCNKGCGMCSPVYEMVHIKEILLIIRKRNPYSGSSRFPLSLSEWSFTICPTPYNGK